MDAPPTTLMENAVSDTITLTVRIAPALKEQLKAFAESQQESLSSVTSQMLTSALAKQSKAKPAAPVAVDSQHPEDIAEEALSAKEIKALRKLLRKSK